MQEGDRVGGFLFLLRGTAEILKDVPGNVAQVAATVDGPTLPGRSVLLPGSRTAPAFGRRRIASATSSRAHSISGLLEVESLAVYKLVAAIAEMLAQRVIAMNEKAIARSQ